MRIYIKLKNGKSLNFPAPIGLVKVAISICSFVVLITGRFIPGEQKQYIDCINFKELKNSMDVLRDYKGLKIVEIKAMHSSDVTIII